MQPTDVVFWADVDLMPAFWWCGGAAADRRSAQGVGDEDSALRRTVPLPTAVYGHVSLDDKCQALDKLWDLFQAGDQ